MNIRDFADKVGLLGTILIVPVVTRGCREANHDLQAILVGAAVAGVPWVPVGEAQPLHRGNPDPVSLYKLVRPSDPEIIYIRRYMIIQDLYNEQSW